MSAQQQTQTPQPPRGGDPWARVAGAEAREAGYASAPGFPLDASGPMPAPLRSGTPGWGDRGAAREESYWDGQINHDEIRERIAAFGRRLSLPTVKRALGLLEGEHPSGRRGDGYEFLDERYYEPTDDARRIDWKATARRGRPIVIDREKQVTGKVWMLVDGGVEMTGMAAGGEPIMRVAFNAMRMFAMLSLRRGDDVCTAAANQGGVVRIPATSDLVEFDRTLPLLASRIGDAPRDLNALMSFSRHVSDRRCLMVIVSDALGWSRMPLQTLRFLRRTHPLMAVCVETVNPFSTRQTPAGVFDARTKRRLPSYLRTAEDARELDAHRAFLDANLARELRRLGVTYMRAGSSEEMFDRFVAALSRAMGGADASRGVGR